MSKKNLSPLDPNYVVVDWDVTLNQYRFNAIPPFSSEEIEKMKHAWYLYYKFFQDNGLTTRTLVNSPEDIEHLVIKAGDFNAQGEEIDRFNNAFGRYSDAIDRGTAPEKAVHNILERTLKALKSK